MPSQEPPPDDKGEEDLPPVLSEDSDRSETTFLFSNMTQGCSLAGSNTDERLHQPSLTFVRHVHMTTMTCPLAPPVGRINNINFVCLFQSFYQMSEWRLKRTILR